MHFSKIPFITLCVITIVASRVIRRDFDTVDDDLALIQDDIDNLGAAVAAFDGTGPLAIAVGQAAGTLEFHLDQATGHTVGSAPFNDLESDELTSTAAALAPQHVVGLSALVAREPDFTASGFSPNVLAQLQSLAVANDEFWDALEAKVFDATHTTSLVSAASTVSAAYASAITAFS